MRYHRKTLIAATAMLSLFASNASAFDAGQYIKLTACHAEGTSSLAMCMTEQIGACSVAAQEVGVEDSPWPERACENLAFDQADEMLNEFYQLALQKTKILEEGMTGSPYTGQEALLRESQRAWLEVRDTTCELSVTYGAIDSGRDTAIAGCKARLTIQSEDNIQTKIDTFLACYLARLALHG